MTQMLDPHSLCLNSIISARFWHFVHDQLNVHLSSYCRSISTRKMNKYVAMYGRDGAQKPLRRMLLACGAVGLSVWSLFVILLSTGSPPKAAVTNNAL